MIDYDNSNLLTQHAYQKIWVCRLWCNGCPFYVGSTKDPARLPQHCGTKHTAEHIRRAKSKALAATMATFESQMLLLRPINEYTRPFNGATKDDPARYWVLDAFEENGSLQRLIERVKAKWSKILDADCFYGAKGNAKDHIQGARRTPTC